MNKIVKLSAVCLAASAMFVGFGGEAMAAGPYSCTNSTYGGSYSSCSTNNTANQASTVATATTILRAASSQTAKLVSGRVASALGGSAPSFKMASNGFTASTGMAGGTMGGKAGAWVSGSWTGVEDDNTATAFDGDAYSGMVGVDYRVAPSVVIGLAAGYEDVDIDTAYNGFGGADGNIQGDGYTVAPYVGVQLTDKIAADLSGGYSKIDYDTLRYDPNTGNSIRGSTDADRYFVNAGISGKQALTNKVTAKIRGSVFYASEDKDAFTETESNAATIAVAASEVELGQALLDARIAYDAGPVSPYALVGLEYDFTKDDVPVAAGQTVSDDDFGAKFGAGLNLNLGPNVTGSVEAYTVEFREDYNEYTATASLRVNF